MRETRMVELGLAALIQYAGARVRRQYVQLLIVLSTVTPGLRKTLDDNVGGAQPDGLGPAGGLQAAMAVFVGRRKAGEVVELASDLALAVLGWFMTAYRVVWAVFGLLAEAALATVASAIREGDRFRFAEHRREFFQQWKRLRERIADAFDAQLTWTMDPPPTPLAEGMPAAGPVTTFAFCAQEGDYRDSGRRVDYRLNGTRLEFRQRTGSALGEPGMSRWESMMAAVSFHEAREGRPQTGLEFDMLAASNDRVFVKVKGRADFYFATPAEMFGGTEKETGVPVPSLYFKLDPAPADRGSAGLARQISDDHGKLGGYSRTHPQAERLPLLHAAVSSGVLPALIVSVKPKVLYRIDTRPPRQGVGMARSLSDPRRGQGLLTRAGNTFRWQLLPGVIASDPPPNPVEIPEFAFDRVLSIGVGNFHFYESWSPDHGGEIQWLRSMGWQNLPLNAALYGTFNGPITDGDGAIDGTCNFYALVRLRRREDGRPRYGILWCDEQTFFTKRWRLLDPRDIEPWKLDLPHDVNLSVHALLRNDEEPGLLGGRYGFSRQAFIESDPFEQGWVDEDSRMSVARQVVVVGGRRAGRAEIFSINFSYGSADYRWRSRGLPQARVAAPGGGNPLGLQLQTLHLREDMTLSLAGRQSPAPGAVAGRWYQRYLPCHRRHPPQRFDHPWRFMPQSTWDRLAQFSHLGVLADVDSRTQFYSVEILAVDEAKPEAAVLDSLDGRILQDSGDALYIRARKFRWGAFNERQKVIDYLETELPGKIRDDDEVQSLMEAFFFDWHGPPDPRREYRRSRTSMFHEHARFRLLRRGALGWLLVWHDKRDDDLVSISDLPREVDLHAVLDVPDGLPVRPITLPGATGLGVQAAGESQAPRGAPALRKLRARIVGHSRVTLPPCVAVVRWLSAGRAQGSVRWEFETPLAPAAALANLWKCHVGYFDAGAAVPVRLTSDGLRVESFRWEPIPAGGTRFSAVDPLVLPPEAERLFSPGEAEARGLCVWFENAVGQVSTPDDVIFE